MDLLQSYPFLANGREVFFLNPNLLPDKIIFKDKRNVHSKWIIILVTH